MKLRLKYAERFVATFAIIAGLVLVVVLAFILVNKKYFETKLMYKAKLADASGLGVATPVFFKGLKVGQISEFYLTKDNYILATVEIYKEYKDRVVQYSAFYKGLNPVTNSSTLELLPGEGERAVLVEGSTIPALDVPEGRALLKARKVIQRGDPLSTMLTNLTEFADALTADTIKSQAPIFKALANLTIASEDLKEIAAKTNILLSAFLRDKNPQDGTIFRIMNNVADLTTEFKATNQLITATIKRADTLMMVYQKPDSLALKMIDPTGEQLIAPIKKMIGEFNNLTPKLDYFITYMNMKTTDLTIILDDVKTTLRQAQAMFDTFNQLTTGSIGRPPASSNSIYPRLNMKEK